MVTLPETTPVYESMRLDKDLDRAKIGSVAMTNNLTGDFVRGSIFGSADKTSECVNATMYELRLYNKASQKRIFKWWEKYRKKHLPVLLWEQVEFKKREILNSIKLGPKDFKDNDKSDGSLDW